LNCCPHSVVESLKAKVLSFENMGLLVDQKTRATNGFKSCRMRQTGCKRSLSGSTRGWRKRGKIGLRKSSHEKIDKSK
jgi:hypothetical protein